MKERKNISVSFYTDIEKPFHDKHEEIRTVLLKPLSKLLTKLRIKPDHITFFRFLLLFPFAYYFEKNPLLGMIFLGSFIILDGVDGPLARYSKTENLGGTFADYFCDHTGMAFMLFCLIFYKHSSSYTAYIYGTAYIVMIFFAVIQNALGIHLQTIIRTKFVLFGMYFIWGIFRFKEFAVLGMKISLNGYYDSFLLFFSGIMIFTDIISFFRIKKKLSQFYD